MNSQSQFTLIIRVFLLLAFLISVSSCSEEERLDYEDQHVRFSLPAGWFVKDIPIRSDTGEAILLQKGRYLPRGIFNVTVIDGTKDLRKLVELYSSEMAEVDLTVITTKSYFDEPKEERFGTYKSLSSRFDLETLGKRSKGCLYVFHAEGKSVVLVLHSIRGFNRTYKEGVEELEKTLRIK